MHTLSIDLETYSETDIKAGGVYKYTEDPAFDILLFAYQADDEPTQIIDLAQGEQLPQNLIDAILDPGVEKWAWNANFERVALSRWLQRHGHTNTDYLNPEGWHCTMVWASALGLPRSLEHAGAELGLEQQKMREGKNLIRLFCTPHKREATLFDSGIDPRVRPSDQPDKWQLFKDYCVRDVDVETTIRSKLSWLPLSEQTWEEYWADQRINDRGIEVDLQLARNAVDADKHHRTACIDEMKELTGLANPNSGQQLLPWLQQQGCDIDSLAKQAVSDALADTQDQAVRRVLELRQETSRSSVKKYQAMEKATCMQDRRAHGLIQFYGAGRTGRWAGRLIQVQNLPRNYLPDLGEARALIRDGLADVVEELYDDLPDTLSQLIRTAFVPKPGHRFIVADYSAIEARVLAWLAGQQSTLQAFRDGKDLYCATASAMFGVPVEKHGINAELRQKGKIAVLACGYQGGVGAMRTMGGERMGMSEAEMQDTVTKWRKANDRVVKYWYAVEKAAKQAITTGMPQIVGCCAFRFIRGTLLIELPSGRTLVYPSAKIGTNRFGRESITHKGLGLTVRMERQETYGGKLVENITQAVARDLLAHALTNLAGAGFQVVMHIHDEAVIEAAPETTVEEVCELMAKAPQWADGLPMEADGYECDFYMKD